MQPFLKLLVVTTPAIHIPCRFVDALAIVMSRGDGMLALCRAFPVWERATTLAVHLAETVAVPLAPPTAAASYTPAESEDLAASSGDPSGT